ncbi:hypothetical protein FBU30_010291 [Linnemannia zychae]|nr:hypothetical protein FBU30_010291 [Linnemannia zychae]
MVHLQGTTKSAEAKIASNHDIENSRIHHDLRDANTPDKWIKRHPELIRLTGKHPFNCEPPVPLLLSNGFITPSSIHYVRNHGAVPNLSWDTHHLSIQGLVNKEVTLCMDMLAQLPSITIPVTLVCAGNRRKEQNMTKQTIGFNWGPGAVSTAVWKGVLVRDLLFHICGGLQKSARFVCFEGVDKLPNGAYGTSLSVERALNPMNDVMIAYEMNGSRLSPDHGYPVRLIVPGVIGGRMVKYLSKITVSEERSESWYHYHDNRVLPSMVSDADMAKRGQWWTRPEYTINDLNINSVICSPPHDSVLPLTSDPQAISQEITLSGYAYNGACKKITRVEVSLDNGRSWTITELEHPEEWPEYQFNNEGIDIIPGRQRYWCWCFWSIKVPVRSLLKCKEVFVRAWDSTLNTQPKDLNWNLMGMMNNCWYRVQIDLTVSREHGSDELVLRFIHPTVPGPEVGGGWMQPPKAEEALEEEGISRIALTSIITSAAVKPQLAEVGPVIKNPTNTIALPKAAPPSVVACYTAEIVSKHSKEDDCWIILDGKVYDCTPFLQEHPGGAESIAMNAGEDCTEDFDAIHSVKAREMLKKYYIGELVDTMPAAPSKSAPAAAAIANTMLGTLTPISDLPLSSLLSTKETIVTTTPFINPKKWQDITLVEKIHLTHNTRLFRFSFGQPDALLGLPLGNHLFLRVKTNDSMYIRAYTPTSLPDKRGHFDLVVKIYFKDKNPRFPEGGIVSQYLNNMSIGDSIAVKGPIGSFTYLGQGQYRHASCKQGRALQIGMICGGTGLTPMYQIMQAILADKKRGIDNTTKVSLLFGNRTEDDILMRQDIDEVGIKGLGEKDRFHLWHVLSEESPEGWKYGKGYISKDAIEEHLFPKKWSSSPNKKVSSSGLESPSASGSEDEGGDDENNVNNMHNADMSDRIVLICGPPPMINLCCIPALKELYGKDFVNNNVFCF